MVEYWCEMKERSEPFYDSANPPEQSEGCFLFGNTTFACKIILTLTLLRQSF